MEWNGPLRNAEVRFDALKFSRREELEALQLANNQWRHCVHRYSPELALRPVKSVNLDLRDGSTFWHGEARNQKHVFKLSDEVTEEGLDADEDDDEIDLNSTESLEKLQDSIKSLMRTSNCTRLNHCVVELLTLQRGNIVRETVGIDFGKDFYVWIKALLEIEAHVQTLDLVDPAYDNMSMDEVYNRLDKALHVQEYRISKDGEEDRGDELCVDVLKKAKRVTIIGYCLTDDGDETEHRDSGGADGGKDDESLMNGTDTHVLDFVFNAPQCEELSIQNVYDGSQLPNKLIQHFQRLESTTRMVATFTWQWCSGYYCNTKAWPEPVAVCHESPFKAVTHLSPKAAGKDLGKRYYGPEHGRGHVYQFKNIHDGSYLTVVQAVGDGRVLQFQKGRFEFDDASEDGSGSTAKKRRHNDEPL
ncbi:hypothetical protein AAVH_20704 [Aphelenchoides avenae]|nr:hypothetical protein AAVH_20704 [Aphelenchus avenae]